MERLGPADPAGYTPEQRRVAEAIAAGPRGVVQGPLAVWLHRPGLADRAQALGQYCRYDSSLPPLLSELAILVTARVWGSEFEWHAHRDHALRAGLPAAAVESIRTGATPTLHSAAEQAVYDVATILNRTRRLDDALYARAEAALGRDGLVDLVGVLGYYTLISMTINAFEVPRPEGTEAALG